MGYLSSRIELPSNSSNATVKASIQLEIANISVLGGSVVKISEVFEVGVDLIAIDILYIEYGMLKYSLNFVPNSFINTDSVLPLISTDTKGAWLLSMYVVNAVPIATECLMSFSSTLGGSDIGIFLLNSGKITVIGRVNNVVEWRIETTAAVLTSGTFARIVVSQDAVQPILYVNEVAPPQINVVSNDLSIWMNQAVGIDNGRIGCRKRLGGTDEFFINGVINQIGILNDSVNILEIADWGNGGKPKVAKFLFPTKCVYNFIANNSVWNGARYEIKDGLTLVYSVNMPIGAKVLNNPY